MACDALDTKPSYVFSDIYCWGQSAVRDLCQLVANIQWVVTGNEEDILLHEVKMDGQFDDVKCHMRVKGKIALFLCFNFIIS